jgi:hypothetical protein
MKAQEKKRTRGRPPKPPGERKRNNVTIRMRDELKAALEAAAVQNQRSLSEEIEGRLEQAFAIARVFGGEEVAEIQHVMSGAFLRGGRRGAIAKRHPKWSAPEWMDSPFCYYAAALSVFDELLRLEPYPLNDSDPDVAQNRLQTEIRHECRRWIDELFRLAKAGGKKESDDE